MWLLSRLFDTDDHRLVLVREVLSEWSSQSGAVRVALIHLQVSQETSTMPENKSYFAAQRTCMTSHQSIAPEHPIHQTTNHMDKLGLELITHPMCSLLEPVRSNS